MDSKVITDVEVGTEIFGFTDDHSPYDAVPILWLGPSGVIGVDRYRVDLAEDIPTKQHYIQRSGVSLSSTRIHREDNWGYIGVIEPVVATGTGWFSDSYCTANNCPSGGGKIFPSVSSYFEGNLSAIYYLKGSLYFTDSFGTPLSGFNGRIKINGEVSEVVSGVASISDITMDAGITFELKFVIEDDFDGI